MKNSPLAQPPARLRLGILFNFRKGWMGGIIYIINLVNSLEFLPDERKPDVWLFFDKDLEEFLPQFTYSRLHTVPHQFPRLFDGYLRSILGRKNHFVQPLITRYHLQGVYPLNDWPVSGDHLLREGTRVVAWIPDLQHKFFPQFFHPVRVRLREWRIRLLLRNTRDLAVSSQDVATHFRKFYRLSPGLRIHVLRFVSTVGDRPFLSQEALQEKYGIAPGYFLISNQFTNHKNHMVVLRAVARLKQRGIVIRVVCTGKLEFKGNERYIAEVRALVKAHDLAEDFRLLGVIPRHDQLSLMRHARAVIQPSLFEGWSTVIEDAKTLQVPVIASGLPVNREQMGAEGLYFEPFDEETLANLLETFDDSRTVAFESYDSRVRNFATSFVSIFE